VLLSVESGGIIKLNVSRGQYADLWGIPHEEHARAEAPYGSPAKKPSRP
jgi:hypothetical protein